MTNVKKMHLFITEYISTSIKNGIILKQLNVKLILGIYSFYMTVINI